MRPSRSLQFLINTFALFAMVMIFWSKWNKDNNKKPLRVEKEGVGKGAPRQKLQGHVRHRATH